MWTETWGELHLACAVDIIHIKYGGKQLIHYQCILPHSLVKNHDSNQSAMCMMSLSRGGDKCSFQANRMMSAMRTRHCLTEATVARNLYFLISFRDGSLETNCWPIECVFANIVDEQTSETKLSSA